MATFVTLPRELRFEIYRELLVSKPKPRVWRLDHDVRGPVTCCSHRAFHTAILRVSQQVHDEAKTILYEETAWTLHIYIIFRGNKIHGYDVNGALHSLSRSEHFRHIQTCVLNIRLFRGESHENNTSFSGVDRLRANVRTVRHALSRAPSLREIEVSWRSYFNLDLIESRCRSLEPLDQLPIKYKLSISQVETTLDRSNTELSYWPDMLKAFRVTLFMAAHGRVGRRRNMGECTGIETCGTNVMKEILMRKANN